MIKEKYLVINGGSSSLKFSLYEMPEEKELINGYIEKIGFDDCFWTLKINGEKIIHEKPLKDHKEAVEIMLKELKDNNIISDINEIKGIGHRVLHGGEFYSDSVLIDDEVLENIEKLTKLGPLHHPGEIAGIKAMRSIMPNVPEVAVFDTAFHQTIPEENYLYAVPYEWYKENGVRKYGFHGTSHKFITDQMKKRYNKDNVNLIICHIGSGASLSCIKNGKCYDTTMGLTPLDGLIMGTRCGNIDSSIIEYIAKERNLSIEEINTALNKKSGLQAIAGMSDNRDLEEASNNGDKKAILALEMLKNSVVKYIAQYYFELNGELDAVVFTAGVGQNAIPLRGEIVNAIAKPMNVKLDPIANDSIARFRDIQEGVISTPDSSCEILVIPTNEEIMILRDTYKLSK